jgi:hypothetical protein
MNRKGIIHYLLQRRCRGVSPSLLRAEGDARRDSRRSTVGRKLLGEKGEEGGDVRDMETEE